MADYITRARLKNRLLLRQIPLPEHDTDLDTVVTTASNMVTARVDTTAFDPDDPPAEVQQVTLMLAMGLWIWDMVNGVDERGNPISSEMWTVAMTQILGDLILDTTPDTGTGVLPAAGVMSTVSPWPSPSGYPDANASGYSGNPNPAYTTRRIMP